MNEPTKNNPEIDALLGAYALDALDLSERALVEAYIARNPQARDEVDELRESAASLALIPGDDDVAVPPSLWERISAEVASAEGDDGREGAQSISLDERRIRRASRSSRILTSVVAAAATIAIVVLGAQLVSVNRNLDDARSPGETGLAAAFDRARTADGAKEVTLASAKTSSGVARVVLLPDGSGYLTNDEMAALPSDQTYQLWALTGDEANPTVISAGILGADPKAAAFKTAGDVHGFVVTVEAVPGVATSEQPPFASATVA
jgi:anti-sigma-K factor RskA